MPRRKAVHLQTRQGRMIEIDSITKRYGDTAVVDNVR